MVSRRKVPMNVHPPSGIAYQPSTAHFWAFCLCLSATKTPWKSLRLHMASSNVGLGFCCAWEEPAKAAPNALQKTATGNLETLMNMRSWTYAPGQSRRSILQLQCDPG